MSQADSSSAGLAADQLAPAPMSVVWRRAIVCLLLAFAGILALYWDTANAMVTIWYRSETFTHAFVVPPISLWLVWRRRHDLAAYVPRPAPFVSIGIAGLAFLWLMGDLTAVNSVTQLAFVAMLVLAVPAILGLAVARAITFPLAFLFFAVPIGDFLMPWFMDMTADFTVASLRMTGVPVFREGLQFVIPSGNWSVVEACSGIRYLIASVTVGTLFAYLNYQSTKRRVLFVLVSILVPVVANWVRAYMIVMLGHLSGNKIAVGVDHLIYGWVFFGVVIMLMFVIGARWSEPEPESTHASGMGGASALSTAAASASGKVWLVTACLLVFAALPTSAQWAIERNAASGAAVLATPAALAAGWSSADPALLNFKPNFENPSAESNLAFERAGALVGVYLGYYRNQDYARKLVSSNNVLVVSDDKVWSRVASSKRDVKFGQHAAGVRTAEFRRLTDATPNQAGRLVAWQIYWIDGTLTANDYLAKVYSAVYQLMGRGDDSAVIVFYTAQEANGSTEATLESFITANYSAIDGLLRQAKAGK